MLERIIAIFEKRTLTAHELEFAKWLIQHDDEVQTLTAEIESAEAALTEANSDNAMLSDACDSYRHMVEQAHKRIAELQQQSPANDYLLGLDPRCGLEVVYADRPE